MRRQTLLDCIDDINEFIRKRGGWHYDTVLELSELWNMSVEEVVDLYKEVSDRLSTDTGAIDDSIVTDDISDEMVVHLNDLIGAAFLPIKRLTSRGCALRADPKVDQELTALQTSFDRLSRLVGNANDDRYLAANESRRRELDRYHVGNILYAAEQAIYKLNADNSTRRLRAKDHVLDAKFAAVADALDKLSHYFGAKTGGANYACDLR